MRSATRYLNDAPAHAHRFWPTTMSGFCAVLVGIGLARFAYAPLLPVMIEARWFSPSGAAYLGAANLAGYLAGALLSRRLTGRAPTDFVIRGMMIVATAAFFACAWPLSFPWFFLWRFASGLSGGALMVLAVSTALACAPPTRRGVVSGFIFMGVGVGIAASATCVALLLQRGVSEAWLGTGALAFLLTILSWGGWPPDDPAPPASSPAPLSPRSPEVLALYCQYGLNACGLTPHMIFLVDFVVHGLGKGVEAGSGYWALFGVGAMIGSFFSGLLGDCIGFGRALRVAFCIQVVAAALPIFSTGAVGLSFSSIVIGAFTPGIVPLVLGRLHELLVKNPTEQQSAWRIATATFAVTQVIAAYGMAFLFSSDDGDYARVFALGAGALLLALAIDLFTFALRVSIGPRHP